MCFSSFEKVAILKLFMIMSGADGKCDNKEVELSTLFMRKIGATADDLIRSTSMDNKTAFSIVSAMTPQKKELVCAFLGDIILVDGHIDKKEILVWSLVSSICDFPDMNIEQAHEIVSKQFGN